MLFNTYKTYPYSADYYGYSVISNPTDPDQTSKVYTSIPTSVRLSVTTSYIGNLIIFTKTKMQLSGKILNLRDKNDVEIYEDGQWEITQTQPITSPLGIVSGYRYKAKLIGGNV